MYLRTCVRSFVICNDAARMRIKRMQKDGAIVKSGEYVENGTTKFLYKKKGVLIFEQANAGTQVHFEFYNLDLWNR